jgi:hypothetical protein
MSLVEDYITELRDIRASGAGVKETSYYPALSNLLNGVGRSLSPEVRCIMTLRNLGAGMPDGGLFTPDQFPKSSDTPMEPQNPARGVVEVKGTKYDAWFIAEGEQVSRYWGKYRQVLVTNLRDWVLVGQDVNGQPLKLETYRLASSERAFWNAAANPRALTEAQGDRFVDFLKRVLLQSAPLTAPQDIAWFLASYAREALARVEKGKLSALKDLRTAMEEALGLSFQGEQGNHFFRSTLVQTLFYGVFSAWVLWSRGPDARTPSARFNWHEAAWTLRVPMIRALFEQVAMPTKLEPLGLVEVLDWTAAALNRVDRATFFTRFEETHAVQYFYEPFLQAFDPELRKQLGVWYTPPEVAHYMVERVDTVLREQLGRPDGLADPDVYVLDPGTGTATYPVEVLKRIARTIHERGEDALAASDIKDAALRRVFGFEIMPAPFVVAHLQLGLLLQRLGAPLNPSTNERASIYLTNALTGWEPSTAPKQHFLFHEFEDERDAAERIKTQTPILVVLGNPPYNGLAGVAIGEERDLSDAYRVARDTAQPQGHGLNDLYVRFFRMAERRIVEGTGAGIVCYISNYSWLDGSSFPAMRERYLDAFDHIWIDNLNGDKYRTGKLTPDGQSDPSIFSTEYNREGIQVGTAIALLVRKEEHTPTTSVHYRNLWGRTKRADLLATAAQSGDTLYQEVQPDRKLGYPFKPMVSEANYLSWPLLETLFPVSYPGIKTSRDNVVVDIDRDRLLERMEQYFDLGMGADEMRRVAPEAMENASGFDAIRTRDHLRKRGILRDRIVRYCYRPFDLRWLYWELETKLLDRPRIEYAAQMFEGNVWLCAAQRQRMSFDPPLVSTLPCSLHIIERGGNFFPLYLRETQQTLFDALDDEETTRQGKVQPNLSDQARAYLADIGADDASDLFYHCAVIPHAPLYRRENADALRQDWPRIPLPADADTLHASAGLGRQVATLLDPQQVISGVTGGAIRPDLRVIAPLTRVGGGPIDPEAGELAVTVGWGHAGQARVTMPGKGRTVERDYSTEERAAIVAGAQALGIADDTAFVLLGERTYDVYLNDIAYWSNVPANVWEYTMGGYQVLKKWLSYREDDLLGRPLTKDEARDVIHTARRIAALLLLEPALDANYQRAKQRTATGGGKG